MSSTKSKITKHIRKKGTMGKNQHKKMTVDRDTYRFNIFKVSNKGYKPTIPSMFKKQKANLKVSIKHSLKHKKIQNMALAE